MRNECKLGGKKCKLSCKISIYVSARLNLTHTHCLCYRVSAIGRAPSNVHLLADLHLAIMSLISDL